MITQADQQEAPPAIPGRHVETVRMSRELALEVEEERDLQNAAGTFAQRRKRLLVSKNQLILKWIRQGLARDREARQSAVPSEPQLPTEPASAAAAS